MARITKLILSLLFILSFIFLSRNVEAQSTGYELLPAPDAWYNDVDGIRLGLRLKGQVPGTFNDGPHRLDAGFWLGTWFPDLPVSYYLSFTEPIPKWSDFGSEASIQLRSSVRTGYHNHGVAFNKRWQQGFDERRYRELRFYQSYQKRFDDEYTPFPFLWSDQDKFLSTLTLRLQDDNPLGWFQVEATGSVQYLNDTYSVFSLTALQNIPINENWGFRIRSFTGLTSDQADPEYLFPLSSKPAINWMENGITRAKGTIPQPWMDSGYLQISGGANLRGYTKREINGFTNFEDDDINIPLSSSITAINAEFDYWNPIGILFQKIPYVSDFLTLNSYLFIDAGTELGTESMNSDKWLADAGTGFSLSLNIPDNLGKPRGFVIRFDMPFWLSDPGTEEAFQFRHLFGIGGVISL
ncbi:MAG: hypothetical protein GVY07_01955 [Bacteroidetes bacterium]|nr:hypothetical protein [Bacteroidota bacterium]